MIDTDLSHIDFMTAAFTVLLILLSAVITFEDIRHGKIRNKWIIRGLLAGIALHIATIIIYSVILKSTSINTAYFQNIGINTFLAFCCGVLLWKTGIWSAGDSKLFLLFSFLLPLGFYKYSYIEYFPSLNLLVNIFAVSFLAVLVKIFNSIREMFFSGKARPRWNPSAIKTRLAAMKKTIVEKWPVFLVMFIFFNALFVSTSYLRSRTADPKLNLLISVATLIFMFSATGKIASIISSALEKIPPVKILLAVFTIAALVLIKLFVPSLSVRIFTSTKAVISFMAIIGILRKFIEFYLKIIDLRTITVAEMKPGIVLSAETIKAIRKEIVSESFFMDGLSADAIKNIQEKFPADHEVEVVTTIPFAPLASIGMLVTILIKQSVIHLVAGLLR